MTCSLIDFKQKHAFEIILLGLAYFSLQVNQALFFKLRCFRASLAAFLVPLCVPLKSHNERIIGHR